MRRKKGLKGVLSIEASISYSIFLMIIVTILYIMRIVYVYGLIQHAVSQTAKELSMYSYLYQVSGLNDINQQIQEGTAKRTKQFNGDIEELVRFYQEFSSGNITEKYNGTTDPKEIIKNIGATLLGQAGKEANQQLIELVVRPLMESYIGADAQGNGADARLEALRVVGGLKGLNLNSSSFFEDGSTIDLVVCYTIDPVMPVDILPSMNLANRACIRGMSGSSAFDGGSSSQKAEEMSVWEMAPVKRGNAIQEQEGVRNLPNHFPAYSAYDSASGKATAECSIDLRDASYQNVSGIKAAISRECKKMENFQDTTYDGVTLKRDDIKSRELVIYIPSSKGGREIDRASYDQAVKEIREKYPDIQITTKEID